MSLLTKDAGLVQATARGAQKMSSRNAAVTRLLSYGRYTLHQGRGNYYIIGEVEPLHSFFDLHKDIEKLALAQYFCELCGVLAPHDEPAEDMLRQMLLGLHYLNGKELSPLLVKCVTEQRLLQLGGYAPDLSACHHCGTNAAQILCFSPAEGILQCESCGRLPNSVALSAGVLAALRHIQTASPQRAYRFTLSAESLDILVKVSEQFLLYQLGRSFKTLDFYHSLAAFDA